VAKDTEVVAAHAEPENLFRYPDGDYSADEIKPEDIFARSDGCVVRQRQVARPAGHFPGIIRARPRRSSIRQ
jgi:hypothetical protein